MKENKFQGMLIHELAKTFDGCLILKNDPNYKQGIPDLSIYYGKNWAMLECKKSEKASKRANQEYYIDKCNSMSFARFIYPENKDEVIEELKTFFGGKK